MLPDRLLPRRGPGGHPDGGERVRQDGGGEARPPVHCRRHPPLGRVPQHQVPTAPVQPGPRR
jgi:hypothetical protein